MDNNLKKIYAWLFIFMIFGLLAYIPVEKYQKKYIETYHQIQNVPQEHIIKNYKYADYVQEHGIFSRYTYAIFFKYPRVLNSSGNKQIQPSTPEHVFSDPKYSKPHFIRDKKNPNILHPYPYKD